MELSGVGLEFKDIFYYTFPYASVPVLVEIPIGLPWGSDDTMYRRAQQDIPIYPTTISG